MLLRVSPNSKNVEMDSHIKNDDEVVHSRCLKKYRGCNSDNNLTLVPFVRDINERVNSKLYLFSKIRYFLTFDAAILVYKQMVVSSRVFRNRYTATTI